MALTEFEIKNAVTGLHNDGHGLYLQVSKTGTKSWVFRYQVNKKRRDMGLGALREISSKQARSLAAKARDLVVSGVDPIDARNSYVPPIEQVSFMSVAKEYIEAHKSGWKNEKHGNQWLNTLVQYAEPVFKNTPINAISTDLVLKVINPIWNTKTETASRVRNRIELVLSYAKVKGLRSGENPAAWRGNLDNVLPKPTKVKTVTHHPALPFEEMSAFIAELHKQNGIGAKALEFTILTAARSGETRLATWSEFDFDKAIWNIPPAHMKASRAHRVPLSTQAIALLQSIPRIGGVDIVFAGRKEQALSDMSLSMVLRRIDKPVTTHGFRSSFRDWAAESTNYPSDMAELALAHRIGSAVEVAYRRGDMLDKRREMMQDWADYINNQSEH